ncbi:pilus assembly protein PilZ [Pontibacillus yanchengensis]|uniref:Pilus assembly protein PilZ n=1 Tax=Pontibacillus yanchengensis TaxID=462910 RepID=A0A6I4ZR83_9BACI|nr:flagellar brake domain-containing protein [Pontibacillus yanchengensis]MYL32725.1 pilus assembly protein PilZ [Pontibacillus yanchengensis]
MIKIGMPITLELKNAHDNHLETYRSKVVEEEEGVLYIDYPVNEQSGKTGFFLEGTQFKVTFVGTDGSVYVFHTDVRGRRKLTIPVLTLHFPEKEKLLRIQRRKYVRVESSVDASVHGVNETVTPFTTVTADISGGGAAIISPSAHTIEQNQLLEVWFIIPLSSGEMHYIYTKSRVIRVCKENKDHNEKVSLEFENIDENDRQTIIRYCFEKQLSLRKRGIR